MNKRQLPSIAIIIGGVMLTISHIARHEMPIGSMLIVIAGVGLFCCHWKRSTK